MLDQGKAIESFGAPLAICLNDCEIDYGQPAAELQMVCFRLRCAFAEMRWGSNTYGPPEQAASIAQKLCQIEPREPKLD
ncbi:MAG TPA: hypothetical protein VNO14_18285 [Blastocatellia bacterium]|nr:hypothetical protein [Blastocatellia bacterium]